MNVYFLGKGHIDDIKKNVMSRMTASTPKKILITGAGGNLGKKLRQKLKEQHQLILLDINQRGDKNIIQADLSIWNKEWVDLFQGVDAVIHLAAEANPYSGWADIVRPNIDAAVHVLSASSKMGVKRFIFSSSNHVMGGYKDVPIPERITTDIPALPGTRYRVSGNILNTTPYGSAKYMVERLGKCYSEMYGITFIAVRIGWILSGNNQPSDIPNYCEGWFRLMWLSDSDFCQLMECCIQTDLPERFLVVNGMSANTGMRWDIEYTRKMTGYEPKDDVSRV